MAKDETHDLSFYLKQNKEDLEPVVESEVTAEELEDEVLEAVEEAKEAEKPKRAYDRQLIRQLRQADRYFNKTCACCAKRVPLEQIEGGKGEVCDSCKD